MKLTNNVKGSLMIAGTLMMLSVYGLYGVGRYRLKIPLALALVLTILSLVSVHVVLSVWYATAYTTNSSPHTIEVKKADTTNVSPHKLVCGVVCYVT